MAPGTVERCRSPRATATWRSELTIRSRLWPRRHDERDDTRHAGNRFYVSDEALLVMYEQALTDRFYDGRPYRAEQFPVGRRSHTRGERWPCGVPTRRKQSDRAGSSALDPTGTIVASDRYFRLPTYEPRPHVISRTGAEKVEKMLPPSIRAVERAGRKVVWLCDPMHGNTISTRAKLKTCSFDAILRGTKLRRYR